ncbi:GAF domain-containing protein [Streptomyces griseorubiginosus]|uniref:Acetoin dehydrogenase operon transcriptional activator AcoR n=1 Tax=Streptomyces griseorubiginosus TaxID=67304 RepID=A0A101S3Z8_9ACTN|nr:MULTISPECIES: GAF domain-containing protein [Streptomyces]AYC37750.1 Acetoin dehydrogenase operon transcriptional activator AcoR [Streptomyces griseorubiginosus]KUM78692.1 diguanylate cyclase [Streptomyces griseorubiginosus]KUN66873.1 diguanylate cyclase [Streptomyces griseorubiginosus]TCR22746.1 GAF domain-containing protein [Streptomyces sp. BK205]
MPISPTHVTHLAAVDSARAARVLSEVRSATLSGRPAPLAPRPVIEESWSRMLRGGVDPDHDFRSGLLSPEEVQRRREDTRLRHVLPVLRDGLLAVADVAHHIMVVADEDGRVLWREGSSPVLRKADGTGFELGADWRENVVGTNGIGTPVVVGHPVQVFASEHFVRSQTSWTCTGAPIKDPRDGRLIGVVDVSGPLDTMHPATLAWVDSVAKLAEARLRELHLTSLEHLRAVASPVLARLTGRALVVDRDGWTAAVTGMPYPNRIALPKSPSPGRRWLPALGLCTLEPLAGGWLIRAADQPEPPGVTRIVLDLAHPRRWTVTVTAGGGAVTWSHELSPRHAELLYLLALHRSGRTAAGLAEDMFGDPVRTVTVRAEMSRVRRYLGAFLEHRPYRFCEDAEVEVLLPESPADLLPHSTAPAVLGARAVTETE